MLIELLVLASRLTPQGIQPTISGLVLTPTPGACVGSHMTSAARIRLDWSVMGTNDADYELQVAINGSTLVPLASTATTTYTHVVTGLVAGGPRFPTDIDFSFEVRVVRRVDGGIVQVLSDAYSDTYGECSTGGPL